MFDDAARYITPSMPDGFLQPERLRLISASQQLQRQPQKGAEMEEWQYTPAVNTWLEYHSEQDKMVTYWECGNRLLHMDRSLQIKRASFSCKCNPVVNSSNPLRISLLLDQDAKTAHLNLWAVLKILYVFWGLGVALSLIYSKYHSCLIICPFIDTFLLSKNSLQRKLAVPRRSNMLKNPPTLNEYRSGTKWYLFCMALSKHTQHQLPLADSFGWLSSSQPSKPLFSITRLVLVTWLTILFSNNLDPSHSSLSNAIHFGSCLREYGDAGVPMHFTGRRRKICILCLETLGLHLLPLHL